MSKSNQSTLGPDSGAQLLQFQLLVNAGHIHSGLQQLLTSLSV
jgi:hypothetical protein